MPVRKKGNRWEVDVSYKGERVRDTTIPGARKSEAKALERRIYEELHSQRLGLAPGCQIDQVLMEWLDGDARSLRSHKKLLSHVNNLLPYVKGVPLDDAPKAAERAAKSMRRKGLSNATINRRIALIRRACNLAYRWGWVDVQIGPRVVMLPENHALEVLLEPSDVEDLAQKCPNPEAGDAVRLLAYTGLRRGEFWRVSRECVSVSGGHLSILVPRSKSGRPRSIPVPGIVEHIAQRLPLRLTDTQLRLSWEKAREDRAIRVHDLRHFYISQLVRAGIPLRAVQELAGHSTLSMTARYAHLAPGEAIGAVKRVFG